MSVLSVSVLIPCFNAAEFLADALESVRRQTFRDFECLVIDDGSVDNSTAIAQRFERDDSRFRLIVLPTNRGVSAARNTGLAEARGKWVALLDADDLFLPNRLEHLTRLGEGLRAQMIVDEQFITKFPDHKPLYPAFGFEASLQEFKQEDFFERTGMFRATLPIGYVKPLMRREFLEKTRARYDETIVCGEDFLFYAGLFANRPRCFATNVAGYLYRRRSGSLSRGPEHLRCHRGLVSQLLDQQNGGLSEGSRRALSGFDRELEDMIRAMPAILALRDRRWSGMMGVLVRQPRILGVCLRLARRRITRTFSPMVRRFLLRSRAGL